MANQVSSIQDMVRYHLKVEPIVYKYISKHEESGIITEIYMVRSIKRDNQSYNVVNELHQWICDCPSFKYRSGIDSQGHCKHIRFVKFLLDEGVEIQVIQ